MTRQYQTHWTTPGFLQMMRRHQEPYTFELQGHEVVVHPGVFSPYYDWSSELVIENLPGLTGKTVLEIGCGSGVISLFCYLKGASFIASVDINPAAIENTIDNLKRNGAVNFECYESDVFSNVSGQFDLIIFNAPYHGNEPKDALEYAVSDPNYRALSLFLTGVKSHLTESGKVILGFSESGDIDLMNRLIDENGLIIEWMKDNFRKEYNAQVYMLS